jgi:HSP20 family protein
MRVMDAGVGAISSPIGGNMASEIMQRTDDPFERELVAIRDVVDRMFDGGLFMPLRRFGRWGEMLTDGMPAVDVVDDDKQYVLRAALPGWKPEDVDITYDHGLVTIKGQVKDEQKDADKRYVRREIAYRSFVRTMTLPVDVVVDKANATFKDGLLTVTLPKSEAAKPKQIKVVSA